MVIYNFLVDQALKRNWCNPGQDKQAVFEVFKFTGLRGNINQIRFQNDVIDLPTTKTRYHVYAVGAFWADLLGLDAVKEKWIKISDCMVNRRMIVDIYGIDGVEMPRYACWYYITAIGSLILAVQEQPKILLNQDTDRLFMRVYSNAYFGSVRDMTNLPKDSIRYAGGPMNAKTDITSLQSKVSQWRNLPGAVYCFVNGFKVSVIDLITAKVGDVAEAIYDSSIYTVKEILIGDLPTFISTLDSMQKYLVHYPGPSENNIDFYDDIDFWIYSKDAQGRHKGVYYHRNLENAVRMLTHRDYALALPYVLGIADRPEWPDSQQLYLGFHIRHGGTPRPLIFENSRIHELYKLKTDDEIVGAMVGIDSTVNVWQAPNLEAAGYTEIMRQKLLGVTPTLVEKAWGYNAITKLLADTPQFTRDYSGQKVIDVPYGLSFTSVAYEYDINGLLLGWSEHTNGMLFSARFIQAHLIEQLAGTHDTVLDETYGVTSQTLDPNANYRMYICPIVEGVPTNVWEDVTDINKGKYAIANGRLTWLVNKTLWYTMVRSDKVVLAYNLDVELEHGVVKFNLQSDQYRFGVLGKWSMQVPMGELDIFLFNAAGRGYSLIEGIDYIVDFPVVTIVNKKLLTNPLTAKQKIAVRFSGHSDANMQRTKSKDIGWVNNGLLSKNNRFDIRDDKVLRITAGGAYYDRTELKFAENDSSVTIDAKNGMPYQVRDIVVPLRGLSGQTSTYDLRAEAMQIDQAVADYLSDRVPDAPLQPLNPVTSYYELYSPFCSKIIYDLHNGDLNDPRMLQQYSDELVKELCAPYEYLLNFDPVHHDELLDKRYVTIHPTYDYAPVDLQAFKYLFMTRVIKYYMNDKVRLTEHVRISET